MNGRKISILILIIFVFLACAIIAREPRFIGVSIESRWGSSWKFPISKLHNAENLAKNHDTSADLRSLQDGDVLVIGTHSNPEVFGSGNNLVDWGDFWKHHGITNPPNLGAVVICGCMIDGTIDDLENIRRGFNAGAAFAPKGSYFLTHIQSTDAIIAGLRDGRSFANIRKTVDKTHNASLDPEIAENLPLRYFKNVRKYHLPNNNNVIGNNTSTGNTDDKSGYFIYAHIFGRAGRIHIGTWSSYKADKKYVNEWLAGISTEFMKKKMLVGGRSFEKRSDASKYICGAISNKRTRIALGQGQLFFGDYDGTKGYLIDGLGCKKPVR